MIKELLGIIYSYLDWTCDRKYLILVFVENIEYIENVWKKNTLFQVSTYETIFGDSNEWTVNGKLHREDDLPAIIWWDGDREWFINDKSHRDGDLPAVEYANGNKSWYKHGKRHRKGDLPAVESYNDTKEWWKNGKLHRLGKPSIIRSDGEEWWANGSRIK